MRRVQRRVGEALIGATLLCLALVLLDNGLGKDPWLPSWVTYSTLGLLFVGLPLGLALRGLGLQADPVAPLDAPAEHRGRAPARDGEPDRSPSGEPG